MGTVRHAGGKARAPQSLKLILDLCPNCRRTLDETHQVFPGGQGVPQDYVQAHMWFNLAAAQGHEAGRENRDLVAKDMTPADISKAEAMAREWMERHGQ